ncbi:hypothetical protein BD311DRAFT_767843 [Dichomitus squalens]|uniref:DUF6533 domain-containing protein n=1 Tax=Dichomitus squalens TaxID=114155 RepID=A0A4Q9MDI2_9APHY|nr:hypothetical protein BD311DRAFT_767843 [Dichomitus squalens]
MTSELLNEAVANAEQNFLFLAFAYAALALLLYEGLVTLHHEVNFMWCRGRAPIIIVYCAIRHAQLASIILNLIVFFFSSTSSMMCTSLTLLSSVFVIIPYLGWAAFLGWRAYALSGNHTLLCVFVSLCSVSFSVPSLFQIAVQSLTYSGTPPACTGIMPEGYVDIETNLVIATRIAMTIAESIVLLLTCVKTRRAWLSSKKNRSSASLADVLFENGCACFFAATVIQALVLLFELLPSIDKDRFTGDWGALRDALMTVVLSRFLLDLSRFGANADEALDDPRGILTTQWSDDSPDMLSLYSLDEEYGGRGFHRDAGDTHSVEQDVA